MQRGNRELPEKGNRPWKSANGNPLKRATNQEMARNPVKRATCCRTGNGNPLKRRTGRNHGKRKPPQKGDQPQKHGIQDATFGKHLRWFLGRGGKSKQCTNPTPICKKPRVKNPAAGQKRLHWTDTMPARSESPPVLREHRLPAKNRQYRATSGPETWHGGSCTTGMMHRRTGNGLVVA